MRFVLTIPPNTPKTNLLIVRHQFMREVANGTNVHIPKGHAYLAGLQARAGRSLNIVIPEPGSSEEWLVGDGNEYVSSRKIIFDPPQFIIELRGYNEDDTYKHSFYIDLD